MYSLLALAAPALWVSAPYQVVLEDPRGDDYGPGSYIYPSAQEYRPGSFDLRRFEVRVEDEHVVFEVTFGAALWRPPAPKRTNASMIELDNDIFVQNVDIYIDTNPGSGRGLLEAVPGRNVRLDRASPWDIAVVFAPLPYLVRSLLDGWEGEDRVILPNDLHGLGRTVTARIPFSQLGGPPDPSWGYAVMISGAQWEQTFDAFNRLAGAFRVNALTIPVMTVAEHRLFGGGELEFYHPHVIDIVTPPGRSQKKILGGYDAKRRELATVPMVYPFPSAAKRARAAAVAVAKPALRATVPVPAEGETIVTVKDLQDEMVVLEGPVEELKAFQLGAIKDDEGTTVAWIVINKVFPKFAFATVVEGADAIRVGARVRFQDRKEESP